MTDAIPSDGFIHVFHSSHKQNAVNRAESAIRLGALRCMPDAQLILFGSRARGDAHRRSDFDLAFKPKPGFRDEQFIEFEEYLEQSSDLIYPVDLVDWRTAPRSLLDRITAEGVLWKE